MEPSGPNVCLVFRHEDVSCTKNELLSLSSANYCFCLAPGPDIYTLTRAEQGYRQDAANAQKAHWSGQASKSAEFVHMMSSFVLEMYHLWAPGNGNDGIQAAD